MDKHKLLQAHAKWLDDEGVFVKTLDQLYDAEMYHETKVSDFLTPDQAVAIEKIARFETSVGVQMSGVFLEAERKKLFMTPPYGSEALIEAHIGLLEIKYVKKFHTLAHKDLLGALMGLGIQRKKVGDIVLLEDGFQVAMDEALVDYVLSGLERVGRAGVKVKKLPLEAAAKVLIPFEWVNGTVKSLRIDAIIALAFKLSRSEAKDLVESEQVKRNHQPILASSLEVEAGDLISVRGYGRVVVDEILGETKKERLRVALKYYAKK